MADLDWNDLVKKMLGAAKPILLQHYNEAEPYAESEFKKIGEAVTTIIKLKALGKITEKKAMLHMQMQALAAQNVLLTVEGIGIVTAQEAINAALGVIRDAVNAALGGWKVL
jgi:hypothetical protein